MWIFVEVPNIKFYGNPANGSRADKCGEADGNNKCISRFLRLWERV